MFLNIYNKNPSPLRLVVICRSVWSNIDTWETKTSTKIRDYGGQVEIKCWVNLSYNVSKNFHRHYVIITPVLECVLGTDVFSNWQNNHIHYLTKEMRLYCMKCQVEAPETTGNYPAPAKIVNQKQ